MYIPHYGLTDLIRVCKHWQPIAERLLYQSVGLGSDVDFAEIYAMRASPEVCFWLVMNDAYMETLAGSGPIFYASYVVDRFLETIRKNRRLAAIVAELHLLLPDKSKPEVETRKFAKILSVCRTVKQVTIVYESFHRNAGKILYGPLMSMRSLVSFTLAHYKEDVDHDTLCKTPRIWKTPAVLRLMRGWSQIEHVRISPFTTSRRKQKDEEVDGREAKQGCCPRLQTIDLGWGQKLPAILHNRDLQNLLHMCPTGVVTFRASLIMDDDTLDVLGNCIRAWAPTLETLVLRKCRQRKWPLSACVANHHKLKVLALESLIFKLDPCILSSLPNLTDLRMTWVSNAERRDMLLAMHNLDMFPAFRTLYIGEANSIIHGHEEDESLDELLKSVRGLVYLHDDTDDELNERLSAFFIMAINSMNHFRTHTVDI